MSASAYENERFHGLHLVVEVASFFFVCEVRQIFFEDAHNIGFCESAVGKECFEPTDEGIDGFGVFVVCAGDYAERDETGHVGAFAFDKKLFAVFFTCGVACGVIDRIFGTGKMLGGIAACFVVGGALIFFVAHGFNESVAD